MQLARNAAPANPYSARGLMLKAIDCQLLGFKKPLCDWQSIGFYCIFETINFSLKNLLVYTSKVDVL